MKGKENIAKEQKIVGIAANLSTDNDDDDEDESEHERINEDEYERPYEGKWRKVQKGKRTNSQSDAILQTRPSFQWRVPSWP